MSLNETLGLNGFSNDRLLILPVLPINKEEFDIDVINCYMGNKTKFKIGKFKLNI